jgi:hypothetical protein
MRRKPVLIMTCVLIASFLTVLAVTAKHDADWENYAYGTLEQYRGEPGLSAEIVDGIWNLKVKDGKVWFYACYQELNLDSEAEGGPEGSVDILEFTLIGTPMYMRYEDESYDVFAQLQVKKTQAQFDGTYTQRTWKTWNLISISEDGVDFTMWRRPWATDWDKIGTITAQDFFTP